MCPGPEGHIVGEPWGEVQGGAEGEFGGAGGVWGCRGGAERSPQSGQSRALQAGHQAVAGAPEGQEAAEEARSLPNVP